MLQAGGDAGNAPGCLAHSGVFSVQITEHLGAFVELCYNRVVCRGRPPPLPQSPQPAAQRLALPS